MVLTSFNGRHFADDTFKRIFLKENSRISIKISLNFVPKSPIYNIPALFQIMAWRRPGDKPISEARMVSLLTHICVARPKWVINVHSSTFSETPNIVRVTSSDCCTVASYWWCVTWCFVPNKYSFLYAYHQIWKLREIYFWMKNIHVYAGLSSCIICTTI